MRQPVDIRIQLEREPLSPTGYKYTARYADMRPLYLSEFTIRELKARVCQYENVRSWIYLNLDGTPLAISQSLV